MRSRSSNHVSGWHSCDAMLTCNSTVASTEPDGACPGHNGNRLSDAWLEAVDDGLPVTDGIQFSECAASCAINACSYSWSERSGTAHLCRMERKRRNRLFDDDLAASPVKLSAEAVRGTARLKNQSRVELNVHVMYTTSTAPLELCRSQWSSAVRRRVIQVTEAVLAFGASQAA